MKIKSYILLLILACLSCSNKKETTFKEIYFLKTIVDNANQPQPNPTIACQNTMTAMQLCAATSVEFSSITLTEPIFSSSLSSGQFTSYVDYCNNLVNLEASKDQSAAVKECFFNCDTSYWQTRRNLNICSASFPTMAFLDRNNDSGTIGCKRNCVSPTNNNP